MGETWGRGREGFLKEKNRYEGCGVKTCFRVRERKKGVKKVVLVCISIDL